MTPINISRWDKYIIAREAAAEILESIKWQPKNEM